MAGAERTQDQSLTHMDAALAQLYRHWSRNEHLCGWVMIDEEILEEFDRWLRKEDWRRMQDLRENREDLEKIRNVWDRVTRASPP